MTRSIRADVATALKTVAQPTPQNFMDVEKAIGAAPTTKLHIIYEELFGQKPEVLDTAGNVILSPNRKQLVRMCQFGYQKVFYGDAMPEKIVGPTAEAFSEELVAESQKSAARVSRGPTIKDLVLTLLTGEEKEYVDPADGQTKTGLVVPTDKEVAERVVAAFPDSKWDKTHWAWYLTQFRKGRFEKAGYGGTSGKPMGILQRDLDRGFARQASEAKKAEAATTRAAKAAASPKAIVVPPAGAAKTTSDPLKEFGAPVTDPALQ